MKMRFEHGPLDGKLIEVEDWRDYYEVGLPPDTLDTFINRNMQDILPRRYLRYVRKWDFEPGPIKTMIPEQMHRKDGKEPDPKDN